jgi:hypothetical protein
MLQVGSQKHNKDFYKKKTLKIFLLLAKIGSRMIITSTI